MKVAILRDNHPESSKKWEIACAKKSIETLTIDILCNDWLDKLFEFDPFFCLSRPPGDIQLNKRIFDEKLFFLENFTKYQVYPGFLETYIYENKSALNWFLSTNEIPHPKTFVSSDKTEIFNYIKSVKFPIVAKTLIGAAGSGVKILRNRKEAENYTEKTFKAGIKRRYGPNRKTGSPKSWLKKAIQSPDYFFKKIKQYSDRNNDVQKNIVLFQQYIHHDFEWRCVKIGDSYFAYKKLKIGSQASGSKQFEYGKPPVELLDFTKKLCIQFKFNFMAVDVFFSGKEILVNEMQTIFGHKNPYICQVNEKSGRYIFKNNQWLFEEGDFNTNESYDLRLNTAIELYENR